MLSLLGEYEVAVDQKGRFLLPAGFRRQLPEESAGNFVINRGFEKCLVLYPMETWNALSAQLKTFNDFNPKARAFKRLFLNGATQVEADGAGRLNLPKHLMESAGITKDVVFSAQDNKVEIWDKDTYYAYLAEQAASYSDLAAEVAGGGFTNPLIA